jgi:hypothetical protein
VWPVKVWSDAPVCAFHSLAVLSKAEVTNRVLSAE